MNEFQNSHRELCKYNRNGRFSSCYPVTLRPHDHVTFPFSLRRDFHKAGIHWSKGYILPVLAGEHTTISCTTKRQTHREMGTQSHGSHWGGTARPPKKEYRWSIFYKEAARQNNSIQPGFYNSTNSKYKGECSHA